MPRKKKNAPAETEKEAPTVGPKTQWVPVERIGRNPELQMRRFPDGATTDPATVERYRQAIEDGAEFPPIVLTSDGTDFWIADGWHQLEAREKLGQGSVECIVHPGMDRDAAFLAIQANHIHGLPRTNADKRHAVQTLLTSPELIRKAVVAQSQDRGGGRRGLQGVLAAIAGVSERTITSALDDLDLHIEAGKVVKKAAPTSPPPPPPPVSALAPDDADDSESDSAADGDDSDGADSGDEFDATGHFPGGTVEGEGYSVPPPRSRAEVLADAVVSLRMALEEYAEGESGGALLGLKDSTGRPFVADITDALGSAVSGAGGGNNYLTTADRNAVVAGAGLGGLAGGKAGRVARCGWLRELADALRAAGKASRAA